MNDTKIITLFNNEPVSFEKKDNKMIVEIQNVKTKSKQKLSTNGVFIFVGMQANTEMLGNNIKKDEFGYIETNEDMQTNLKGIYAVGDVRSKKYRQITTAVSDGTIAAISITKEIDD